jgi:O-antigen chain-terminating methyltransferase
LDNRFNLPEDARADLVAFKQRIEQLDFEHPSIREALTPPRPRFVQQSLWGKFNSLLVSLARLTDTRRRVEAMEDEAANFRQAVMTVVGDEFTKAVIQVVEQEIVKLHRTIDQRATAGASALDRESGQLKASIEQESGQLKAAIQQESAQLGDRLREEYTRLKVRADGLEQALNFERLTRQKAFTDFDRRLILKSAAAPVNAASEETTAPATPVGLESLLETFYYRLEERYRGSRDEIKQRLLVYRNDLRAARERTGASGPVVDIGCGRGELLEVLVEDKFQAIGVDSNPIQLDAARHQGVAVVEADALDYLRGLDDQSVLAVTGIHIIEHIPFPQLASLMQQVVRVLKKGGIAIFETPNPHNLIVGATTFYFDPTHVRQLPPEVMQILLEATGFSNVETRPLHPYENFDYIVKHHNINPDVAMLLFGPQDYAVIGVMG